MPSTIADGVLIIFKDGRWKKERMELITPVFSSRVCQASVRSRKFIHMGRMKISTMKLCWFTFICARIMASG